MITFFKAAAKAGAFFAASLSVAMAAPAAANSSANAAAVDVTKPVKDSASPLGNGDDQFRELFAQWEGLDNGTTTTATASQPRQRSAGVSIPSRMPLEGASFTSGYGMRTHPVLGGRRRHNGVDLAAPTGTPVYATGDGIVEMAQWYSSYGNYIQIGHGNELETRYAHLSRIVVSEGSFVEKGDLIGYVGSTGRSTGPHLHYEVRMAGVAVNPIPYMVDSETQIAFNESKDAAVGGD